MTVKLWQVSKCCQEPLSTFSSSRTCLPWMWQEYSLGDRLKVLEISRPYPDLQHKTTGTRDGELTFPVPPAEFSAHFCEPGLSVS